MALQLLGFYWESFQNTKFFAVQKLNCAIRAHKTIEEKAWDKEWV